MQSATCLIKVAKPGDFLDTPCSQRNLNKITEGHVCGKKHVLTWYLRREVTLGKHSGEAQRALIALHPLA